MKFITFNVNGLRSILQKDITGTKKIDNPNIIEYILQTYSPDFLCLQEIKCPQDFKLDNFIPGDYMYEINSSKTKKGYSGTAIITKHKPLNILYNFHENEEGRLICLEYPKFYIINTYVPNSKPDLSRLEYRTDTWEQSIVNYISNLKKPVIYLGDLNVAPTELDIHNAKSNEKSHGYTVEERSAFANLIKKCKLVDTFRHLHPNKKEYTWFSPFQKSRERNKGWRIDHILVSKVLKSKIKSCDILSNIYGSDHLPVIAEVVL